jgi:hypothetical protein
VNKPDRADVRRVHVRVNGITFESVWLRRSYGTNDFDIVIDDPHIGRFALTAAVPDLQLRDEDSDWRQVTLDELKKILVEDDEFAKAAEAPQASERESFNLAIATESWPSKPMGAKVCEESLQEFHVCPSLRHEPDSVA